MDGQGLYEVTGDVLSTTTATVSFTVRNVTVGNDIMNQGLNVDAGNLIVEDVVIGGDAYITGNAGTGNLSISDSIIGCGAYSWASGGNAGAVTVSNSNIGEGHSCGIGSWSQDANSGNVTVYNTVTESGIYSHAPEGVAGNVSITQSQITDPWQSRAVRGNECTLTDTYPNGYLDCTTLTLTDTPPDLSVTPLTLELDMGESFNPFTGVSADDVKDGDISDDVSVIGSIGDEPGTYELIYSVTDSGTTLFNTFDNATTTSGPSTASITRTVTRVADSSGTQSTRVGARSSSTSHTTSTPDTPIPSTTVSLDATLNQLRTVLSQPIATTDPEKLKELLNLLLQLVALLTELMGKAGR